MASLGGWNYRIIRHRDTLPKWMLKKKNKEFREKYYPNNYIEWFAVHEVFYNKNGKPHSVTNDPIKVIMEEFTKKDFNCVMKYMKQAGNRPVLNYEGLKEIKDETVKSSGRINNKSSKGK